MSTQAPRLGRRPTPRARTVLLAVIMGCQLMMVLDASIVTTALPHIRRELHFSSAGLSWVQNSYVLVFGGLLLLGARIGDLYGRRRVFTGSVGLFAFASLVAGLAPSAGVMIGARALQGVAAALAIPSTLALLVMSFPEPEERTRVIAIYSAVIGAGASVGIILGGVLTEFASWRFGLLINVPFGIAVVLLAPRYLPETPRSSGRVDVPGALTITIGMSALVFGFVHAAGVGWGDASTVAALAVATAFLVAFVAIERRVAQPITPLRLFHSVPRSGAYLARILVVGAMFSTFYFLSQYLQNVRGFSPLATGLTYIPMTAMFFAMVYVVRPASSRLGKPLLLIVSLVVAMSGMFWLSRLDATTSYFPQLVLPLLVLGVGQGIAIILLTDFGMAGIDPADAGAGSGLVNTAHQLGGSVGLALLTVVFSSAAGRSSDTDLTAAAHGYASVFTVATGFYALAIVVAIAIHAAPTRTERRALEPARA